MMRNALVNVPVNMSDETRLRFASTGDAGETVTPRCTAGATILKMVKKVDQN